MLTDAEIIFLKHVIQNPGSKLDGGESWNEDSPLWNRPEELGLITCVGSYKWEPTDKLLQLATQGLKLSLMLEFSPETLVTQEVVTASNAFSDQVTYLQHPDVPYHGTINGDSPQQWNLRLTKTWITAVLSALKTSLQPQPGIVTVTEIEHDPVAALLAPVVSAAKPMLWKNIVFMGKPVVLACDGKCSKAWGLSNRPSDAIRYYCDEELGDAPADPGTYEGDQGKPRNDSEKLNKWCARECERSTMEDSLDKIKLPNRSKPKGQT